MTNSTDDLEQALERAGYGKGDVAIIQRLYKPYIAAEKQQSYEQGQRKVWESLRGQGDVDLDRLAEEALAILTEPKEIGK